MLPTDRGTRGVPEASHWGVAAPRKSAEIGTPAPSGLPVRTTRCRATKKDGSRCSARPVKDRKFCVGHLRQRGEW